MSELGILARYLREREVTAATAFFEIHVFSLSFMFDSLLLLFICICKTCKKKKESTLVAQFS